MKKIILEIVQDIKALDKKVKALYDKNEKVEFDDVAKAFKNEGIEIDWLADQRIDALNFIAMLNAGLCAQARIAKQVKDGKEMLKKVFKSELWAKVRAEIEGGEWNLNRRILIKEIAELVTEFGTAAIYKESGFNKTQWKEWAEQ